MSGIIACIISNVVGLIGHAISGGGGALIGGGGSSIIDFFINGLGLNAICSALFTIPTGAIAGIGGGGCSTILSGIMHLFNALIGWG